MKNSTYLVSLLLFCAGCATTPLNEAKRQEVNNVGAAVLFNEELPLAYVGTTIFNNEKNKVNIAGWNLNEIVSNEISSQFKSINKTYKKINFDKAKVNAAIQSGNTVMKQYLGTTEDELNNYLFETASNQGAEYLFIFKPIKSDNFPHPKGFGLFCGGAFGAKGDWQAYNLFHVALWDLKTKSKIYQTAFTPNELDYKSGKPCVEAKGSTPEKFALGFKDQFQQLAKKSAQMTIKSSGLIAK